MICNNQRNPRKILLCFIHILQAWNWAYDGVDRPCSYSSVQQPHETGGQIQSCHVLECSHYFMACSIQNQSTKLRFKGTLCAANLWSYLNKMCCAVLIFFYKLAITHYFSSLWVLPPTLRLTGVYIVPITLTNKEEKNAQMIKIICVPSPTMWVQGTELSLPSRVDTLFPQDLKPTFLFVFVALFVIWIILTMCYAVVLLTSKWVLYCTWLGVYMPINLVALLKRKPFVKGLYAVIHGCISSL